MMKTLQKLATATVAFTIIPLAAGIAEAATIKTIDPLMVTQNTALVPPFANVPTSSVGITSSLLGSVTRMMTIEQQSAAQTGDSVIASIPRGSAPGFSLSTGDFTDGKATLDYGTFGPVDFTSGGAADRVSLKLTSSDLAGAKITVTIDGISKDITVGIVPPISILDFTFSSFAGLDATAVNSFSVELDPVTAGDLSVEFIETRSPTPPSTPEPASLLGLFAVGGLAASVLKKKSD